MASSRSNAPCTEGRPIARVALLVVALALGGCAGLLPAGESETPLPWNRYEDAVAAIDAIEPYVTTRQALAQRRIDPAVNPAITILTFTDLLQRFPAIAAVSDEKLERGVSDCLDAGKHCTAYSISVRQVHTKRVGNFWLDVFNFKRHSVTTGWSLSALIVFVDDTVVYVLAGGQPNINEEQVSKNPLGPLQGLGESLKPTIK